MSTYAKKAVRNTQCAEITKFTMLYFIFLKKNIDLLLYYTKIPDLNLRKDMVILIKILELLYYNI